MDKELIVNNEVANDGKTVYLYFNPEIGLYIAYGFSAFFITHFVDVIASFSEDLEMPLALLRRKDVDELRLSLVKREHDYRKYYRMELKHPLALNDYTRWAESVKWK